MNIISWVSVISVGIGTFALVVVLSAFNGLEGLVESLFESFDSDIRIEAKSGKVFSEKSIPLDSLTEVEGVANYTRVVEEVVGLRFKKGEAIATIKGVDASFLEMSKIDSALIEGESALIRNDIPFAITGYGLASSLGLYMNKSPENLTIYAPKRKIRSTLNPMNSVYRKIIAPGGVFYISPEYDNKYVLVPISFAKDLLRYQDEITSIEVKAKENTALNVLKDRLAAFLGEDFKVTSRYEFNALIYKTNKTEKWVIFMILVFILIIAAFNILSSLSMLILEKKKDISTLKSLGANNALIKNIFFIEGLMINLSGALSGMALGILVCWLQQTVGLIRLQGGIVEFYPVEIKAVEMLYILLTVLVIGFLTAWFPVKNLTKVES